MNREVRETVERRLTHQTQGAAAFDESLTREACIGMECWSKWLGSLGAKIPRYSGFSKVWPWVAGARPPHRHPTGVC
jgi:hypothetical protein